MAQLQAYSSVAAAECHKAEVKSQCFNLLVKKKNIEKVILEVLLVKW